MFLRLVGPLILAVRVAEGQLSTAVSLNNDVDTNKELVGHGYSNLLSGLIGTVLV